MPLVVRGLPHGRQISYRSRMSSGSAAQGAEVTARHDQEQHQHQHQHQAEVEGLEEPPPGHPA
ncbi:hypothetical protein OG520_38220 [Streptomyces sp. NBC_00984]|uniref:hypothetical protein n=1 Tax=Streptomyces sp. NBC_00984 TaxID=2903700 RepID=UPI003863D80D|nr:hypothetical protein OG520_38220 [Streptomyces sp. NBC_00984]